MSTSVRRDIVFPMEGLMDIIQGIRKDPMKPITKKLDEPSTRVEEVVQVEQALIQLGALLQMGLGEAGAKIIRTSLKDNGLDVNVAGKIVQAIFGFCDIRNFTDCTEVLQAEVVKLVNNVGSIVHDVTIENHGAPNKNIGDAFLLVWKPKGSLTVRQIAESALRSYVSIIIEMTRDKVLMKWAARHDIQERMPGYKVRLGCGLHYGWAIECAIGSQHKIDASYLSPHVNLSSRLEAATKQYGVPILLSGEMHGLMSDEVKTLCRMIDRVTVKGSNAPMYLYTYDVPSLQRFGGQIADEINLGVEQLSLYDYFKRVRPYTSEKFRLTWQMAMHSYLGGADGQQADWKQCKLYLNKCLAVHPDDGPALAILNYIENTCIDKATMQKPTWWLGYRPLTEK
jgi:class 3 adenylate cyclase